MYRWLCACGMRGVSSARHPLLEVLFFLDSREYISHLRLMRGVKEVQDIRVELKHNLVYSIK